MVRNHLKDNPIQLSLTLQLSIIWVCAFHSLRIEWPDRILKVKFYKSIHMTSILLIYFHQYAYYTTIKPIVCEKFAYFV